MIDVIKEITKLAKKYDCSYDRITNDFGINSNLTNEQLVYVKKELNRLIFLGVQLAQISEFRYGEKELHKLHKLKKPKLPIGNFKSWGEVVLYYDEPNRQIQVKIQKRYKPVYRLTKKSYFIRMLIAFISEGKNGKKLQNSKPKKWKYNVKESKILSKFNKTLNERLGITTGVKPFFWNREKKIMECNCNKVLKKRKD